MAKLIKGTKGITKSRKVKVEFIVDMKKQQIEKGHTSMVGVQAAEELVKLKRVKIIK